MMNFIGTHDSVKDRRQLNVRFVFFLAKRNFLFTNKHCHILMNRFHFKNTHKTSHKNRMKEARTFGKLHMNEMFFGMFFLLMRALCEPNFDVIWVLAPQVFYGKINWKKIVCKECGWMNGFFCVQWIETIFFPYSSLKVLNYRYVPNSDQNRNTNNRLEKYGHFTGYESYLWHKTGYWKSRSTEFKFELSNSRVNH